MKRLLLTLIIALATVTAANAQIYLGGSLGLWHNSVNKNSKVNYFNIAPEVGYSINKNFAVGLALCFDYQGVKVKNEYNSDTYKVSRNLLGLNPYVRYSFLEKGPIKLFVDGSILYGAVINKNNSKSSEKETYNRFEIGLIPGIAFNFNEHFTLLTHIGFLGYRTSSKESEYYQDIQGMNGDGFGFYINGSTFNFGVYYNL